MQIVEAAGKSRTIQRRRVSCCLQRPFKFTYPYRRPSRLEQQNKTKQKNKKLTLTRRMQTISPPVVENIIFETWISFYFFLN